MKKLFLLCFLITSFSYAQVQDQFGKLASNPNNLPLFGSIGIGMVPSLSSIYKFEVNGSTKVTGDIITDSNIGIGTSSFVDGSDTYRLSVDGKIRADGVKIYTTWADFVFEVDYKLPTLNEVESYINKNGHLKDIPSAKDVEANGIELGEMNKLLLQKIEELTLYVIDLNKEVEALKSKE